MSRVPESRPVQTPAADPRAAQLDARFRTIGFAKAQELLDVYHAMPVRPDVEGDRALQLRQTMMRGLVTHYALLRRQLPAAPPDPGEGPGVIDEAALRAIIGDEDNDAA